MCEYISRLRIPDSAEETKLSSYLWPLPLLRKRITVPYHIYLLFVGFLEEDLIERAGCKLALKKKFVLLL